MENSKPKYVIITPSIANMGGAQAYVCNKVKFLRRNGYEPVVVSVIHGNQILEFDCLTMRFEEMRFLPASFSRKKQERICQKILDATNLGEDTVIESSTLLLAVWGELLASKVQCRHFCFSLQESYVETQNELLKQFLLHKYARGELAGIFRDSAQRMFPGEKIVYKEIRLPAYSGNPVAKVPCDPAILTACDQADLVIGTVGRTDKMICRRLLQEIHRYASAHPEVRIAFVVIGGPNLSETDCQAAEAENLHILNTGYITPIPESLIKKLEVGIATSGSVKAIAQYDIPTIAADVSTGEATGVYNYDTLDALHGEGQDLCVLLDRIVFGKYCQTTKKLRDSSVFQEAYNRGYEEHFEFLSRMETARAYYDVCSIRNARHQGIISMLLKILPAGSAYQMIRILSRSHRMIQQENN